MKEADYPTMAPTLKEHAVDLMNQLADVNYLSDKKNPIIAQSFTSPARLPISRWRVSAPSQGAKRKNTNFTRRRTSIMRHGRSFAAINRKSDIPFDYLMVSKSFARTTTRRNENHIWRRCNMFFNQPRQNGPEPTLQ